MKLLLNVKTLCVGLLTSILILGCQQKEVKNEPKKPNIIVVYVDDLGYGDLSSYGSIWNQTPEVDKMASEGLRFTDFYAGSTVCSPSRAALLTGSQARRIDMDLDAKNRWVLFPVAEKGLNPKEKTIPQLLKNEAGYATAMIGKWHLGDQKEFLPTQFGFDYWYGLPYSNDMENKRRNDPPLPLMRNDSIIEQYEKHGVFNQKTITKRYTDETIKWIGAHKEQPFFLYLAQTMPHHPAAARPEFYNKTSNPKKAYGASVAEVSWSTGQILDYLKKEGLAENTLVVFTSDNGGDLRFGASNGILKGMKGQTHEGGIRVPCIAWWPGKIKPGTTSNNQASAMDFYATFAKLAGIEKLDDIKRDGIDISEYFLSPEKKQKPRPFFYWHVGYLQAVRYGDWKVSLIGSYNEEERKNIKKSGYYDIPDVAPVELFNLRKDPGETKNIADEHPEMVVKLVKLIEDEKAKLGQWTEKGPELRPTIKVSNPKPLLKK